MIWALLLLLPALPAAGQGWTYSYADDFSTDKAQSDAYLYSTFLTNGATPLPEPYVRYLGTGAARGLVLMGYENKPALVGYRLPVTTNPARRMFTGTVSVEVSFPCNADVSQFPAGELSYSISPDGVTWSDPQSLWAGQRTIPVESTEGACYVLFRGTRAMIDNVQVSLSGQAATIRVPADYGTIQQAIDAAGSDDVIEVAPGTYPGSGNQDIDFRGKRIVVRSANGAQSTIIRCEDGHRGFYFHRGETAGSVLSGFTIRGGRMHGADAPGGGIYCEFSSPTIINCVVEDCSATAGGGIGCIGGDPLISGCTIKACTAGSMGAGIYVLDGGPTIAGCTISGSLASGSVRGGGAYCAGGSDVTFKNCVIAGNSASAGAGILAERNGGWCSVSIVNCTIAENRSSGGVDAGDADVTLVSSIVWGNDGTAVVPSFAVSANYSDVQGGYFGQGNINANPQFTDSSYHLGSKSPCIDAGALNALVTEPSPNGGRINMGAYGGTAQARASVRSILYVDASRGRQPSYSTIQAAIDAAHDGDVVLVWPGVYAEEITFRGKAITVRSAADAAVITAPDGYACSFYTGEDAGSVLANFVIAGCGESGVFCNGASPTLKNLTVVQNSVGIEGVGGARPEIVNCILWENSKASLFEVTARYSCIEPIDWDVRMGNVSAEGNLSDDPLFADSMNGDYHLRSRYGRYVPDSDNWVLDSVMSPCIDAGDPGEYPRDERMPNGRVINMGAYGGTPYASLSSGPACQ